MLKRKRRKRELAAQKAQAEAEARVESEKQYLREVNQIVCPNCGAQNTALIYYGLVDFDEPLTYGLAHNFAVLGGCDLMETNPKFACNECRHTWK